MTIAEGANVNVNRFTLLPKDPRELIVAVLLALSIAVNIWCWMAIREDGTEQRLKQYNLDWFKSTEFAELKGKVELDEKMISIFGPQCNAPTNKK